MTDIKAVVFDYGCVLAHNHLDSDLQAIAECIGVEPEILKDAYWHFRHDFDSGITMGAQYFQKVAEKCSVTLTTSQIKMCIDLDNASWSRPNEPIVDWAHRLRKHGTKIAILSNMPQDFRNHLPNCVWLPEFDHATYSCELKAVKPSHDIYHHSHGGLTGIQAEEILFIDDRQPNIDAAKELGWQGHLFTDANDLHERIKTTNLVPVFLS